jgi:hypothetical protein
VGAVSTQSGSKAPLLGVTAVVVILVAGFAYFYVSSSSTINNLQNSTASLGNQVSSLNGQVASLNSVTSGQASSISSLNSVTAAQASSVTSLNGAVSSESSSAVSLQATVSALNGHVASLNGQVGNLQNQVQNQSNLIATLRAELKAPSLKIWTVNVTIRAGYILYESVPDTFDYYDTWTSTGSITVYYLTVKQASQYLSCSTSPAINCVSGTYYDYGPTTSASDIFKQAEGCGAYVAIYQPSSSYTNVTIYPNVSVTYNPASSATGACT